MHLVRPVAPTSASCFTQSDTERAAAVSADFGFRLISVIRLRLVERRRLTISDLGTFLRERPVYLRKLTFADIVEEIRVRRQQTDRGATDDQDAIACERLFLWGLRSGVGFSGRCHLDEVEIGRLLHQERFQALSRRTQDGRHEAVAAPVMLTI
ncbi:hypothetical protein [Variovorax guangxiensis]|uniref:hypothetical protein n=1 Tax=Variovorax guangxiensis TaxID=1775474 RepID=UPI002864BF15|nr:hypothetical protein [Variovorax guangxiensis]MDR6858547.1 hypothetical protein [Variovorax guangxiensis]